MFHANAALTFRARLWLAQLVVDRGWSNGSQDVHGRPAHRKEVADRYRTEGVAGMAHRSIATALEPDQDFAAARPPDRALAMATPAWPCPDRRPSQMQASTVHQVLVRCRINRLSHIDRVTGEPLRCYEHRSRIR